MGKEYENEKHWRWSVQARINPPRSSVSEPLHNTGQPVESLEGIYQLS